MTDKIGSIGFEQLRQETAGLDHATDIDLTELDVIILFLSARNANVSIHFLGIRAGLVMLLTITTGDRGWSKACPSQQERFANIPLQHKKQLYPFRPEDAPCTSQQIQSQWPS